MLKVLGCVPSRRCLRAARAVNPIFVWPPRCAVCALSNANVWVRRRVLAGREEAHTQGTAHAVEWPPHAVCPHCRHFERCLARSFSQRHSESMGTRCQCSDETALQTVARLTRKLPARAAWSLRHRRGCALWTGGQADPASRNQPPSIDSGTGAVGARRVRAGGRTNGPSGGARCVLRCQGTADRWWRGCGGDCSWAENVVVCGCRVRASAHKADCRQPPCAAAHRPAPPHRPVSSSAIAVAMPARRPLTPRNNP